MENLERKQISTSSHLSDLSNEWLPCEGLVKGQYVSYDV